jgi:hypothetical protein
MDKETQKNQRKQNLELKKKEKKPKSQDPDVRPVDKNIRQKTKEAYEEEEWEDWDRYYNH